MTNTSVQERVLSQSGVTLREITGTDIRSVGLTVNVTRKTSPALTNAAPPAPPEFLR